jgi:hypothetical protein
MLYWLFINPHPQNMKNETTCNTHIALSHQSSPIKSKAFFTSIRSPSKTYTLAQNPIQLKPNSSVQLTLAQNPIQLKPNSSVQLTLAQNPIQLKPNSLVQLTLAQNPIQLKPNSLVRH